MPGALDSKHDMTALGRLNRDPTRRRLLIATCCGVGALTSTGSATAGGLFIPGAGSQAQPRAGAFVAKADDPTALFHNPAGIAKQDGTALHIGSNFVDFALTFRRAGSYDATPAAHAFEGEAYPEVKDRSKPLVVGIGGFQSLPSIVVSSDLGTEGRFRFAIGTYVPNAYPARDFEPGYDFDDPNSPPPPQRYDAMSQEVIAMLPSAVIAARVTEQIDVGLRLSYGFARMSGETYAWGVRNYQERSSSDSLFKLEVTDPFLHGGVNVGSTRIPMPIFGLGVLYRPLDNIEVGLSYRSAIVMNGAGDGEVVFGSDFENAGMIETIVPETESPQCGKGATDTFRACVDFQMPQMASVGARWVFRDDAGDEIGDIEFDVQWEDWSSASDITVFVDGKSSITGLPVNGAPVRHGLRDTVSLRLGGAYSIPVGDAKLIGRAGAAYDSAAAPTSWTRVDLDGLERYTLGAGLGWEIHQMRFEFGAGVVLEPTRVVENDCNPSVLDAGCSGTGEDTPFEDRNSPDPVQPLSSSSSQLESPYNAGRYEQHYVLLSLGFTRWF